MMVVDARFSSKSWRNNKALLPSTALPCITGKWNPLLHADSLNGWVVPAHLPFVLFFFKALLFRYGLFAAASRWFVIFSCVVVFVLGATSQQGSPINVGELPGTSIIVLGLEGACGEEFPQLQQSFVNPVSGFFTVSQNQ